MSSRGVTPSGLAYTVVGSGPPLLWLSGNAYASAAFDRYVAAFQSSYTCIVFDARGSGRTRPALYWLTTSGMAYDALEVLRHVGYDSAHVHGLSLGGMVAQELAIRAPHRVRTLVLGATTAGGTAATPARLSTLWSSISGASTPVARAESTTWRGAMQQSMAASTHDAAARLHRIQTPTLVMHGDQDRLLPPENAEVLARLIPGAQLRVVHGAGHFYPVRRTEEAAQIALQWMSAQSDVAGTRSSRQRLEHLAHDLATSPVRWTKAQLMPLRHTYRTMRPKS